MYQCVAPKSLMGVHLSWDLLTVQAITNDSHLLSYLSNHSVILYAPGWGRCHPRTDYSHQIYVLICHLSVGLIWRLPWFQSLSAAVWDLAPPAACSDPTHDLSRPAASAAPHSLPHFSTPSHPGHKWTSAAGEGRLNATLNMAQCRKGHICMDIVRYDTSTLYWNLFIILLTDSAYFFLCTVKK